MSFLVAAAIGFCAWSLVEYFVHGVLGHRFRTFVSPLHWGHHREERAVFTTPVAWVPIAGVLAAVLVWGFGTGPGIAAWLGLLAGFLRYEAVHWRIHFREPRSARQERLRVHHLAHHHRNPRAYHGVTTTLWDRVFRTLPADRAADYAAVSHLPPLPGPSNFLALWSPRQLLAQVRHWRAARAE